MTTLTSPVLTGTRRLLAVNTTDHRTHVDAFGPLPSLDARGLIRLLTDAGLTGRGGAGFPTARKLAAVAASRRPVVVGNAMEGEPLSHKDKLLLQHAPHLVLDGLAIVAGALRARRTVLALGPEVDDTALREALQQRSDAPEVRQPDSAGFVSGQEAALVDALGGGPGLPTDPITPVWRRGLDNRATLVSNIETFGQVALLARYGARWFREAGTHDDPGTFLATISGTNDEIVPLPGVVEIARGTRLSSTLAAAEVPRDRVRAVLVGGYHGSWVPADGLDARLSSDGLAPYDARVGAGILHVLDVADCPIEVTAEIADYLAGESAAQCGPCINGLPRMADTLHRLAVPGADPRLVAEVDRLRALVVGRGACAHPDGTARLVASAMRVFADHVDQHLRGVCDAAAAHR